MTGKAGNCNEMRVIAPKSTEMQTMCVYVLVVPVRVTVCLCV